MHVKLADFPSESLDDRSNMTKKGRIFKTIRRYFGTHPAGIFAWLWVTAMPFIGSIIFAANYNLLEAYRLHTALDYFAYTVIGALLMGLALLPTTLIALASGYYFGWTSLTFLILGYSLASVLGYVLGKVTNMGFTELLFKKNPKFHKAIESRQEKEGSLVFFVRISPVVPFAVSNFLFANLNIKLWKVLIYGIPGMLTRTVIGFAAGVAASSYMEAKQSMNTPLQWGIGLVLLIIGVAGIYSYVRKKR
ncbi:putative membrane protein YdjX (TVP38/TMEM64 family) [Algoriphagus sp. 4150]|uniref:TVP38/TMEM64 family protein n=1 Tax=Algoriphagus sp. 4150 TaxID=2817756 RepID=UPI0028595B23|nr:VTT domain-containing protein [Algoriphagus sp. 4150]MDR7130115.1 putative membrane protein YdjX (TVP38/TMEM64 family) [Algoriphagus sp. 4150]